MRRLEEASKNDAKKECTKVGQKCVFRRLGGRVNEIMLAWRRGVAGYAALLGRQEPPIIKTDKTLRTKPYTEKLLTESECRE